MDKRLIAVLATAGLVVAGVVARKAIAKRRWNSEACVQEEFVSWLHNTDDPKVGSILKGYEALTDTFDYSELLDVVATADLEVLAQRFAEEMLDLHQRSMAMVQLTGRV